MRQEALDRASQLVCADRNLQYGEPADNWDRIARLLNSVLSHKLAVDLEPHDIALINIVQKLARLQHDATKLDSWVDIAGYAACAYEVTKAANRPTADGHTLHVKDITVDTRWHGYV
jgi:hypothetical protein